MSKKSYYLLVAILMPLQRNLIPQQWIEEIEANSYKEAIQIAKKIHKENPIIHQIRVYKADCVGVIS